MVVNKSKINCMLSAGSNMPTLPTCAHSYIISLKNSHPSEYEMIEPAQPLDINALKHLYVVEDMEMIANTYWTENLQ